MAMSVVWTFIQCSPLAAVVRFSDMNDYIRQPLGRG